MTSPSAPTSPATPSGPALSVLDLSPVASGGSGPQALANTLALARHTDDLGYARYWMAEHHNMSSVVSSAPEVILGALATVTRRMRIGSGGIMLPNHSPLKVAEMFRTLEGLAPGRVDLGLGRAPGTDQVTALALRRNQQAVYADDFPEQLAYLRAFSGEGEFPAGHPFASVQASPQDVPLPPLFLLSSSGYSARLAAQLGLGFAFAHHFSPAAAAESMRMYRDEFQPSEQFPEPHAILTVSAVAADTEGEADHLARTLDLMTLNIRSGRRAPLPSPEEAAAYPYSAAERAFVESNRRNQFIGTAGQVRARMLALAGELGADELMVTTNLHSFEARKHSYALLAGAFGLAGTAAPERQLVTQGA